MTCSLSRSARPFLALLLCAIFAAGGTTGYAASPAPENPQSANDTLLVVAILPMSGFGASFGTSASNGITLAKEQQNDAGGLLGKTIDVVVLDGECSESGGATAAATAINTYHTHYILGEVCTSASTAIAQLANPAHVLQISPLSSGSSVTVDQDGNTRLYSFRACMTDPVQGWAGASFASVNLHAGKAFLLHNPGDPYSTGLYNGFKLAFTARGGQIVGDATYSFSTDDFSSIITDIINSAPGVVYLPDYANMVNLFAAQARASGVSIPILGGDGWDSTDLEYATVQPGYFANHFASDDPNGQVPSFALAYTARFPSTPPDAPAALGYEAARLLFQGIQAVGVDDATAVSNSLAQLQMQGLLGPLSFDAQHNPQKPVVIIAVAGGDVQFSAEIPYSLLLPPRARLPMLRR